MAYIVMAFIAMAYIVMAYIVMAYIAMAYIVMAYIVMAFLGCPCGEAGACCAHVYTRPARRKNVESKMASEGEAPRPIPITVRPAAPAPRVCTGMRAATRRAMVGGANTFFFSESPRRPSRDLFGRCKRISFYLRAWPTASLRAVSIHGSSRPVCPTRPKLYGP